MRIRSGLYRLLRQLSESAAERSVYAVALGLLIRSRAPQLALMGPMLPAGLESAVGSDKLRFWSVLARALVGRVLVLCDEEKQLMRVMLQQTDAYSRARERLKNSSVLIGHRTHNYQQIARDWKRLSPLRLFVLHHFDRRGYWSQAWHELLLDLQQQGWSVLISSSGLAPASLQQIRAAGFQLALRDNRGLCLGAYRDLSVLLLQNSTVADRVQSLVLANDSMLPLSSPSCFVRLLEGWDSQDQLEPTPLLRGLTDSAERDCYHLQSFCLHANRALLQHPAWLRFWLGFSLSGSKDDLINHGEIGLSQALLAAGVQLRPAYPLVQGLLEDPAMAEELQRYGIWQPRHVNQSLFAWQSLLARGFPLVKKHVLFELIENQGLPMAMAEFSRWINPDRRALIAADLQELFVSRYSGDTPQLG